MKSPYIEEPIPFKNPKSGKFINLAPIFVALMELPERENMHDPAGIGSMLDDAVEFFVSPEMEEVAEKSPVQFLRYQRLLLQLRNMFNSMHLNS